MIQFVNSPQSTLPSDALPKCGLHVRYHCAGHANARNKLPENARLPEPMPLASVIHAMRAQRLLFKCVHACRSSQFPSSYWSTQIEYATLCAVHWLHSRVITSNLERFNHSNAFAIWPIGLTRFEAAHTLQSLKLSLKDSIRQATQ